MDETPTFPPALVLSTLEQLYRREAERKGLRFRVRACRVQVAADAMVVLRIVNELLAVAVDRAVTGTVLVGCRRCGESVRLQIHYGSDPAQIGPSHVDGSSDIALAHELATEYRLHLSIERQASGRVVCSLELPLAPVSESRAAVQV